MRLLHRFTLLFVLIPALFLAAACSTIEHVQESPEARAIVQAAIQVAVVRAVGTDPAAATEVAKFAGTAVQLAGADDVTTTDELESAIRAELAKADLTPEEQILANTLIAAVRAQIRARIEDSTISGDALVQVVAALEWVREAAQRVAESPPETG